MIRSALDENIVAVNIPADHLRDGMVIQLPSGRWVDIHITSATNEKRVVVDAYDELAEIAFTVDLPRDGGVLTSYYYKGE
jgi:hypothetical protein